MQFSCWLCPSGWNYASMQDCQIIFLFNLESMCRWHLCRWWHGHLKVSYRNAYMHEISFKSIQMQVLVWTSPLGKWATSYLFWLLHWDLPNVSIPTIVLVVLKDKWGALKWLHNVYRYATSIIVNSTILSNGIQQNKN
jgi:hypothetical protein